MAMAMSRFDALGARYCGVRAGLPKVRCAQGFLPSLHSLYRARAEACASEPRVVMARV